MNWQDIITFFITMLAITNPFGNLAIFLGLTPDKTVKEQKQLAYATSIAVLVILIVITWVGQYILALFSITLADVKIAGGLVVLLLGLSMLQSHTSEMSHTRKEDEVAKNKDSIAVVPMAIPIIAGPGAIVTVIINTKQYPTIIDGAMLSIVCLAVAFVIWLCLHYSSKISHWLGVSGIKILMRIMGLILMSIAVSMLMSGLLTALPGLA